MFPNKKAVVLALAAALLLACGVAAQEVTLVLALREGVDTVNIYRQLLDKFEAENPGIKVEIFNTSSDVFAENVLVQAAAGVPPDVVYIHYTFFPDLMRQGLLLDLKPFIERDGYSFDDFFPPALEQFVWNGEDGWAIPRETSSAALFYNIDIFNKSGVPHPSPDWTWDDVVALGRRLTQDVDGDGTIDQWALRGLTAWFHLRNIIWSWGAEILSADSTKFRLHEPAGVEAIQWVADLGLVERIHTTAWADRFVTGRAALEIANFWQIQENLNNTFAWDIADLPYGPAGKVIRIATGGHGIMKGTKHPEEAWKLLKFLSTTEAQAALAKPGVIIPARRTAATSPEFLEGPPSNRMAFITAIQFGRPDTIPTQVNTELDRALAPVWTGAKPASVALQEVQPVIDKILADLNQ